MFLIFMQGIFLLAIGFAGPSLGPVGLVGLVCAMAVFMDAANGAAYSLLPHVRPEINGILSGFVGGSGNLGGIFWSVGYRFTNYAQGTWIIGVGSIAVAVICMTIPPIPRSQRLAGEPADVARGIVGFCQSVVPGFTILPDDQPCDIIDILHEQLVQGEEVSLSRGRGCVFERLELVMGGLDGSASILHCHLGAFANDLSSRRV